MRRPLNKRAFRVVGLATTTPEAAGLVFVKGNHGVAFDTATGGRVSEIFLFEDGTTGWLSRCSAKTLTLRIIEVIILFAAGD